MKKIAGGAVPEWIQKRLLELGDYAIDISIHSVEDENVDGVIIRQVQFEVIRLSDLEDIDAFDDYNEAEWFVLQQNNLAFCS